MVSVTSIHGAIVKKILITGVTGLIGRLAWKQFGKYPEKYDLYGMDRTLECSNSAGTYLEKDNIPPEKITVCELTDYQKVLQSVSGMDTVIQLAALPNPMAPWKSILSSNIDGLHNVFEACREAGVKRIIYASSIRVSQGYYNDIRLHTLIRSRKSKEIIKNIRLINHLDLPRPEEPYGAAKLFGEGLARMYSDVHGISCICIRFGAVNGNDLPFKESGIWCSHRDASKIIELCVKAPKNLKFDIFYAVSKSRFQWIDSEHIKEVLGFESIDCENDRVPMIG